jgi:transcription-repair coupling factor (superfamily II helicase)
MLQKLQNLAAFSSACQALRAGKSPLLLDGLAAVHKAHFAAALCRELGRGAVLLTDEEAAATRLMEDINRFYGEERALLYPEREFTYHSVESVSREYEQLRLGVLRRLQRDPSLIVVGTVTAALQPTLLPEQLSAATLSLRVGQEYPPQKLLEFLVQAGYQRAEQVEGIGQFAARGGIVDFYPPQYSWPIRLEYWGDEVDSIAAFSLESQRREDSMKLVEITPVRELLYHPAELAAQLKEKLSRLTPKQKALCEETLRQDMELLEGSVALPAADRYAGLLCPAGSNLLSYRGERLLLLSEGVNLKESLNHTCWQQKQDVTALLEEGTLAPGCAFLFPEAGVLAEELPVLPTVILDSFPRSYPGLPLAGLYHVAANALSVWGGALDPLCEDLESYRQRDWTIWLLAGTERGALALTEDLTRRGFAARFVKSPENITTGKIFVLPGGLSSGFEYPELRWAVITTAKGGSTTAAKSRRKTRRQQGEVLRELTDLTPGMAVVHVAHGIGIFEGIVKQEIGGITKDYIKIRYAGTDMLYVPVTQLDLVTKYVGGKDEQTVKLNRLGGNEWNRTRQRVKKSVEDMAAELIQLYAKRSTVKGFAFSPDSDWQTEFEQRFEYEETDDQLRCIEEIKHDMEQPAPMDRLLCGDVGFGKTEVALRAVFKCVLDGKQCAVLVPTTILAWQHYQTFLRRLEGYPVTVELLSRFRTPKQQKEILQRLADGKIDVVVGTHRLVQEDVRFRDLGLCVIDEEQRFGVKQKEKFKQLKGSVDILTLSATPIPRTLNMALSGLRDMSTLEQPPVNRQPVQTYVIEHDWGLLADAMRRELDRGGQVYYLHNRTETIDQTAAKIRSLLGEEVRIGTAHGKLDQEQLGDIMSQMTDGELDILVCTTIIETGIDLPNANTLIIENAENFGLAQLHQLRGRVGRSTRRASAYLTYRPSKILTEDQNKRLSAIREYAAFGSGFKIAMRDLEIRGAGNLLGPEQSGFLMSVGYDLYLRLLEEAVLEEQGKPVEKPTWCTADFAVPAAIPEKYIPAPEQRMDLYRRMARVRTQEEGDDIIDELIDRYGEPPKSVTNLIAIALLRARAAALGMTELAQKENSVRFSLPKPDFARVAATCGLEKYKGRLLFSAGEKPYLSLRLKKGDDVLKLTNLVLTDFAAAPQ